MSESSSLIQALLRMTGMAVPGTRCGTLLMCFLYGTGLQTQRWLSHFVPDYRLWGNKCQANETPRATKTLQETFEESMSILHEHVNVWSLKTYLSINTPKISPPASLFLNLTDFKATLQDILNIKYMDLCYQLQLTVTECINKQETCLQ